ncbi:unnamed protein product [Ascophyllum nodosum]
MLVLFETPAGYALFKMAKESALKDSDTIFEEFSTPEKAAESVKLKAFMTFADTADAVAASTEMIDSKMGKSLKRFLTKNIVKKELKDKLAVSDSKLGNAIKEKLSIKCVNDTGVMEVMRGIRGQLEALLASVGDDNLRAMRLGLSHSLSRYKLKFSADKVDTMIVQAIGLLDELDKEINTYAMRVKEWYGWHFPEMAKIVNDNMLYAKLVVRMGVRTECKRCDFSDILEDEDMTRDLREAAEVSMGTEITIVDEVSIKALADQARRLFFFFAVVALSEYRLQLSDYLRNRMQAIAPNLTIMVGELVGARLIAHAGSLINLAKQPASTVQILGAEKALFRALKTKHDTPKYGLIYHASLIGQAAPKHKGKISRVLAAKCALATRVDALADDTDTSIGIESRAKVEMRLRNLQGGVRLADAAPKTPTQVKKYDSKAAVAGTPKTFSSGEDMLLLPKEEESENKKRKDDKEKSSDKKKKRKKELKEQKLAKVKVEKEDGDLPGSSESPPPTPSGEEAPSSQKKKKKKEEKAKAKIKKKEKSDGVGTNGSPLALPNKEEEEEEEVKVSAAGSGGGDSEETPKKKKKKRKSLEGGVGDAAEGEMDGAAGASASKVKAKKKRKSVGGFVGDVEGEDTEADGGSEKKKKKKKKRDVETMEEAP